MSYKKICIVCGENFVTKQRKSLICNNRNCHRRGRYRESIGKPISDKEFYLYQKLKKNKIRYKKTQKLKKPIITSIITDAKNLITYEELVGKFKELSLKEMQLSNACTKILIKDKATAIKCRNSLNTARKLKTEIQRIKDDILKPYLTACNDINRFFDKLYEKLKKSTAIADRNILNFQESKLKSTKQDLLNEYDKIDQECKDRMEIIERLVRVRRKLGSMITGGAYVTKEGVPEICKSCKTIEDIDKVRLFIKDNYPPHEEFKDYELESKKILSDIESLINRKIKYLDDTTGIVGSGFEIMTNGLRKKLKFKLSIYKERKKKEAKKIYTYIFKGVYSRWVYEITDINLIRDEFKILDKTKIYNFFKKNLSKISKNLLTEPGMRFYIKKGIHTSPDIK